MTVNDAINTLTELLQIEQASGTVSPHLLVTSIESMTEIAHQLRLSNTSILLIMTDYKPLLLCENLKLDRQKRLAWLDEKELRLTLRAFSVLEYLMLHSGEVVSRDRLLHEVWGWSCAVKTRAVDMRIAEVRRVLGAQSEWIETYVGQGYRFRGEVRS